MNIEIKADGLDKIIERLSKITPENINQLASDVADEGVAVASSLFPHHIHVYKDENEKSCSVVAEGRDVVIQEFGGGDTVVSPDEFVADFEATSGINVESGSYSREHAREYIAKGYWVFGGKKYTFVRPRRAMYNAFASMRDKVHTRIKEMLK